MQLQRHMLDVEVTDCSTEIDSIERCEKREQHVSVELRTATWKYTVRSSYCFMHNKVRGNTMK